jgi:predicted flap endonuclease-1-like 5' DNA nuclease
MWDEIVKRWIELLFWWVPRDEGKPPDKTEQRTPSVTEPSTGDELEGAEQAVSDDLTVIKGIGPALQEKLRALGIVTFSDLASADPRTLTERLKGSQPISEARVRGWTETARKRTET